MFYNGRGYDVDRTLNEWEMKKMKNYMAIDQYGHTYHDLGPHPRKALIEKTGNSHTSKMYTYRKGSGATHIGYVVGQLWCTLYEVIPFREVQP